MVKINLGVDIAAFLLSSMHNQIDAIRRYYTDPHVNNSRITDLN
jgi:hypothetical protein